MFPSSSTSPVSVPSPAVLTANHANKMTFRRVIAQEHEDNTEHPSTVSLLAEILLGSFKTCCDRLYKQSAEVDGSHGFVTRRLSTAIDRFVDNKCIGTGNCLLLCRHFFKGESITNITPTACMMPLRVITFNVAFYALEYAIEHVSYWATVCKTVRHMLSDRCLSVCPVCDVRAQCPNGCTDQDETWHAGRPRPWPHCVRWGPRSPSPKGRRSSHPNFRPISIVAKRLDASRCHLVWWQASAQGTLC